MKKDELSFSQGFDRGNYGNAYESRNWESWSKKHKFEERSKAYQEGMLLGFFSNYELHEIGDEMIREWVEAIRLKRGSADGEG